jgi:GAF domain-containing protein
MREYLDSVLCDVALPDDHSQVTDESAEAKENLTTSLIEMQHVDVFDESKKDAFQRLTTNLAHSFDAPISLLLASCGRGAFWEPQCGLPDQALSLDRQSSEFSICTRMIASDTISIVSDTAEDPRSVNEPFFRERGIRFYAGAPIKAHDGTVIGALCVLDTRPRQVNDKHKEMLLWIAEVVATAIELQTSAPEASSASSLIERP